MKRGFGDLRFAHLAGVSSDPDEAIEALWHLYTERTRRIGGERRVAPPIALRGVALELAANFAGRQQPLPARLLSFLCECLALPRDFTDDPQPLYEGVRSLDFLHGQARLVAEMLDSENIRRTGRPLSWNKLAQAVEDWIGVRPQQKTLKEWRAGYADVLATAVPAGADEGAKAAWDAARPLVGPQGKVE